MLRVSGLWFEEPFTGCLRVPDDTGVTIVRFDSVVVTRKGYYTRRTEVAANERDDLLAGLHFHERTQVFLGEFLLGYLVLKRGEGMSWFAEPINHAHLNTFGKPGVMSQGYESYLEAYGFFNMSVPHPCRSELRCIDQRVEFDFFPSARRV